MALARPPRPRRRLLAGLRRRVVDAGPRHHLPAHGFRGRAVLSVAGDERQGHGVAAAQRADRATHRTAVAGKDRPSQSRGAAREPCAPISQRPKPSATGYAGLAEGAGAGAASAQGRASELATQLEREKQLTARALAQVELLNQQIAALRRQLAALEDALEASEKRDRESQSRIADLGQRLNVALAQRVQELRAIAPTSSAGCARSSASGRTFASSATASCSSRRCSSTPARPC